MPSPCVLKGNIASFYTTPFLCYFKVKSKAIYSQVFIFFLLFCLVFRPFLFLFFLIFLIFVLFLFL